MHVKSLRKTKYGDRISEWVIITATCRTQSCEIFLKIQDGKVFTKKTHYQDCANCLFIYRTTQYTPYQPEIAQGRLESLLNYQTMVSEMTGLDVANASLLDEGTAAAEAMTLCNRHNKRKKLYISDRIHPQTLEVIRTRTEVLGLELIVGPIDQCNLASREISGILMQYPDTCGNVEDYADIAKEATKNGVSDR